MCRECWRVNEGGEDMNDELHTAPVQNKQKVMPSFRTHSLIRFVRDNHNVTIIY